MEKTIAAAREFIESGGKCVYRYGWAWKGANAHLLTKEDALKELPKYSFGMGFYELSWLIIEGGTGS